MAQAVGFGSVEKRGKNAYRAYYMHAYTRHSPGRQFSTKEAAKAWLRAERVLIDRGEWTPPAERRAQAEAVAEVVTTTFEQYALEWIERGGTNPDNGLSPKAAKEYRAYVRGPLAEFGPRLVGSITANDVERWWESMAAKKVYRSRAYAFMKSVMRYAVRDGLVAESPCQIERAGAKVRGSDSYLIGQRVAGLSIPLFEQLVENYDRPRFKALLLLVGYCAMRPGEVFALTRSSFTETATLTGVPHWVINVSHAVSDAEHGGRVLGPPKTPESVRSVPVPPHLVPILAEHLERFAEPGPDGLLFPSTHAGSAYATEQQVLGSSGKQRTDRKTSKPRRPTGWYAARAAIDMPDLRLYDLRHWGRLMWRRAGLDDPSIERLMGHIIPGAKGHYAHPDTLHAWPSFERLSEMTGWMPPQRSNGLELDPRVFLRMTPEKRAEALTGLSGEQLAALFTALTPEQLGSVMGAATDSKGVAL